jgi:N,N-dimethylformamidase
MAGRMALTIGAWIYPTNPSCGDQAILSHWMPSGGDGETGTGLDLRIDPNGKLRFMLGNTKAEQVRLTLDRPVGARVWQFVVAAFDLASGTAELQAWSSRDGWAVTAEESVGVATLPSPASDLLVAASFDDAGRPAAHFNGKIERPSVVNRRLDLRELTDWIENGPPPAETIASWDFSLDMGLTTVRDTAGGSDGTLVNMPTRAMTGHDWTGTESNWRHAPSEYGAIHFHDDDLSDACWDVDFSYRLPADLPSGVYAARLRAGDEEDHVPFVVRPRRGRASARIAVLLPTLTYLAYADEIIAPPHHVATRSAEDDYVSDQRLVSQYNWHSDGSGVAMASLRRPLLNLRPRYRYWLSDFPFGLGMDLYLTDWLDHLGIAYDVVTDHDLHSEGCELLRHYRAVLTGSHPEYVSRPMMEAIEGYLSEGGRLMYLGGNGFYWATGVHAEYPEVSEIRRENASWAGLWESEPGEMYLSTTGDLGGLWDTHAPRPRTVLGVWMVLQTREPGQPYHVQPGGRTPEMSFIFQGVDIDAPIGDFGLTRGGAAGIELDATDYTRGTPSECVVVARATGFNPEFHEAHADMTFVPGKQGGAVFSVSSIAWMSSLSHNNYENSVSRVTRNVLEAFLADGTPAWVQ